MDMNDIKLKAELLHYGVGISRIAAEKFGDPFLAKRRVYSNYDDSRFLHIDVPQEIIFPNSQIAANAILKETSPWAIVFRNNKFFLQGKNNLSATHEITFPLKPSYYDKKLRNGELTSSYVTKIFNHSLGIFVRTNCFFAEIDLPCKFCSIATNQGRPLDTPQFINKSLLLEAVKNALLDDSSINDIFISGGIISNNLDKNFLYYLDIAENIKNLIMELNLSTEVTLNVYPPRNINLIDCLKNTQIVLMISIETFNAHLRKFICPGKAELFNEYGVNKLLDRFVSAVGYGRVLTFVIDGIEDRSLILLGAERLAQMGVCTVAHVLHIDPGTWIEQQGFRVPLPEDIIRTTIGIAEVYQKYHLDTHIFYGGRSSFDAEASLMGAQL